MFWFGWDEITNKGLNEWKGKKLQSIYFSFFQKRKKENGFGCYAQCIVDVSDMFVGFVYICVFWCRKTGCEIVV
jgi:hypothetical protein